ncbi:S1C family serine protease [Nocardioides ferulae]|uniref:S1C family serine protease n=1 Tax=Nocardioides ferulae TaxID=2340821 RepID=UPI000EAF7419|nr:trypsin-like peptidase domain-containing protein [Nocardioides ferulae]
MDERPDHPGATPDETPRPEATADWPDTTPFGPAPTYPTQPPPNWTPPAPRRRRSTGLAAAVVAAALVVGGGAGFGGAALWSVVDDDTDSGSGSSGARTTAQVAETSDEPAAEGSVEAVAQQVLPSVVKIDVAGPSGSGSGSGIILSSDGQILTNEHVVGDVGEGGTIRVSFGDGSTAPAEVLGTDPLTDTAVIQAQDVDGLTPVTLGSSGDLDVGETVVAIGSPFGLESTVTSGIVSALNRPVDVGPAGEGNTTTYPAIQTDAAINPGNSGGPLVNMAGHVVGINASIRTDASTFGGQQGGSIGLGFAIPIDAVMPIVEQMAAGEEPTHARLGITVSDNSEQAETPEGLDDDAMAAAPGALVQEIGDGSTAEEAGLEAGDVIIRVDDTLITSADSLVATIRSYRPGDEVEVAYLRGDEPEQTVTLTLDSDAEESGRAG